MPHLLPKSYRSSGFTFIELILYISIISIVLFAIVPFSWNAITSGQKSQVQQEVSSNARYISEKIKLAIRQATGINSVAAQSISLSTNTPATNPTVIDLASGNLRITEGSSSPVVLNSADTTITALTFTNYSSTNNKSRNINFNFTLAAKNTSVRQEYDYEISIQSSAEIRSN